MVGKIYKSFMRIILCSFIYLLESYYSISGISKRWLIGLLKYCGLNHQ